MNAEQALLENAALKIVLKLLLSHQYNLNIKGDTWAYQCWGAVCQFGATFQRYQTLHRSSTSQVVLCICATKC